MKALDPSLFTQKFSIENNEYEMFSVLPFTTILQKKHEKVDNGRKAYAVFRSSTKADARID